MHFDQTADIIIVGGGIAGAIAALSCAVKNIKILWFAPKTNFNGGIQISPKTILSLKKLGVYQDLKKFFPKAQEEDWELSIAGQRVQIIKATKSGGVLKMGTEVVTSSDGSLAALLGASPGASTAVTVMLEVLNRCWSQQMASDDWEKRLKSLLPSYGEDPNADKELLNKMRQRSDVLLGLS